MALSGDVLGDLMKAAVDALSEGDKANRTKVFRAMGKAIVTHIQSSAQVAVAVATTGSATAQTGTGTGTVL